MTDKSAFNLAFIKDLRLIAAAMVLVASLLIPVIASAAQLNQSSVRLGRLGISASTGNDMLVTFKLNTTPTSVESIKITFPNDFQIADGTPTPSTTGFPNTPASIAATPGTLTSVADSGDKTITVSGLSSGSLTSSDLYGFIIPSGTITNPGTQGQYDLLVESLDGGSSVIDSTVNPVYITGSVTNNEDLVNVTASVAPSFTFELSANSDVIPNVDPSTTETSPGITMSVSTNSPLGYTAFVKSANAELRSATSPATPIVNGAFDGTPDEATAGTTKYGFAPTTGNACVICTGSLAYDSEYSAGAGAPIASNTGAGAFNGTAFASFVSRLGYTEGDDITLRERISVSNTIGYANDYTDTLTIVAAGNY